MSLFDPLTGDPAGRTLTREQSLARLTLAVQEQHARAADEPNVDRITSALRDICNAPFKAPVSPEDTQRGKMAMMNNKTRLISRLGAKFSVKFYVGGAQRGFGFYDNYLHAMRIADMLILHFHNRRVRKFSRPLVDSDFNISLAHARADLDTEPDFKSLFCHLDAVLPEKVHKSRRGQVKKTVGSQVVGLRAEILEQTKKLDEQAKELREIKQMLTAALLHGVKEVAS